MLEFAATIRLGKSQLTLLAEVPSWVNSSEEKKIGLHSFGSCTHAIHTAKRQIESRGSIRDLQWEQKKPKYKQQPKFKHTTQTSIISQQFTETNPMTEGKKMAHCYITSAVNQRENEDQLEELISTNANTIRSRTCDLKHVTKIARSRDPTRSQIRNRRAQGCWRSKRGYNKRGYNKTLANSQ